jgi:hypothetical protein
MLALHRWVGLVVGGMILVAAGSAIALNHQDLFLRPVKAEAAQSPYGRYMLSLEADPRQPDHLLAGTSDGLFRSADGGRSWQEAVLPVPAEQVVALESDAARAGVVYAAFRTIGVYRSEDGGELWEEVSLPFNPAEGETIQAMTVSNGALSLLTPQGLYRQAAGGPWRHVPAPQAPARESDARAGLKLIYDLHDGKFWGSWGVWVTDAVSAALIALVLTGYAIFFARALQRRLARRRRRAAERALASAGAAESPEAARR